ncbi:hypothetical protein VNI00_011114 [Paramarasmius palmivorus]|uniref:Uncharacterized protein n=1 Tax=Paramarasmius palmivorus TaxID=297713 RepID=A0AAW0CEL0_9AGAR
MVKNGVSLDSERSLPTPVSASPVDTCFSLVFSAHSPVSEDDMLPWNLPLVQNMPWRTDFIYRSKEWPSIIPPEFQDMASSLLVKFRDAYTNSVYRNIVTNQATLVANQKSAEPLPGLLFALKFLDVAVEVSYQVDTKRAKDGHVLSSPPKTVPKSKFEGQTRKLRGVRTLSDKRGWPRILLNMQVALSSCGPVPDPTLRPEDLRASTSHRLVETAVRLLGALTRRDTNIPVLKAIQNIEMTAFFINYLMQGNCDFPQNWKTLATELEQAADREGVSCGAESSLPPITRLRQGLFLALAVSPLVLLCDIAPMSNNLARIDMLRAWYHYGTERPPFLRRVESMLWTRLFAVAKGAQSPIDALKYFVQETATLMPLAAIEQGFFASDDGIDAVMPVGITYKSTQVSRKFVALSVAHCLAPSLGAVESAGSLSNKLKDSNGLGSPQSLELSSILESELWDGDSDAQASVSSTEGECCTVTTSSGTGCSTADMDRASSPDDSSSPDSSSSSSKRFRRYRAIECGSRKGAEDEDLGLRRKRKRSFPVSLKLQDDLPWPSVTPYTWKRGKSLFPRVSGWQALYVLAFVLSDFRLGRVVSSVHQVKSVSAQERKRGAVPGFDWGISGRDSQRQDYHSTVRITPFACLSLHPATVSSTDSVCRVALYTKA